MKGRQPHLGAELGGCWTLRKWLFATTGAANTETRQVHETLVSDLPSLLP